MMILWTVVIATAFVAFFYFVDLPMIRRGRAARAANGGRPTPSAWASIAVVIVIAIVLVAAKH